MNITFVGGGVSSLIASILLKEKYPSIDVTIIEKDETLGKRFKVAGNGRCNFSNSNISSSFFHNGNQVKHIIDQFNLCKDDIYSSLGIYYFIDNYGRYYPLSESGKSLQGLLLKRLESLSIKVINDFIISIDDSSNNINGSILLKSDHRTYKTDILVLALGGQSQFYSKDNYLLLNDLRIKINEPSPSLSPLVTKEKIPPYLQGKRVKAIVSLIHKDQQIYEEKGEVIFKKDGLSGICVFNISSIIDQSSKNPYYIDLDCSNDVDYQTFKDRYLTDKEECLQTLVNDDYKKYLISVSESNVQSLYKNLKKRRFTYLKHYPLKDSQVTRGGISLESINLANLSLFNHPKIYTLGELMDVDGLEGGYNIFFAFASAYYFVNHLKIDY